VSGRVVEALAHRSMREAVGSEPHKKSAIDTSTGQACHMVEPRLSWTGLEAVTGDERHVTGKQVNVIDRWIGNEALTKVY
jgi:hypothetical protein